MSRKFKLALLAYVAIGITTFGYAADRRADFEKAGCPVGQMHETPCYRQSEGVGVAAAVFWPFYWSWMAWS